MSKIKLNRKRRNVVFLAITVFLIINPVTLMLIEDVSAFGNSTNGVYGYENRIDMYKFTRDFGTHDWVAFNAIKLVAAHVLINPLYDERWISWLWDYGYWGNIQFGNLDNYPGHAGGNAWYQASGSTAWQQIFPHKAQWLLSRRTAWYLFGTMVTDNTKKRTITQTFHQVGVQISPAEVFSERGKFLSAWGMGHVMKMDNNNPPNFIKGKSRAGGYAFQAGSRALYYLSRKTTWTSKATGEPVDQYGAFEPAALCLGAMAHYIADSGTPMHATQDFADGSPYFDGNRGKAHFDWEMWMGRNTNFDVIGNMPTNVLYATAADVLLMTANVVPKSPDIACEDNARFARNINGTNFGYSNTWDPYYYHPVATAGFVANTATYNIALSEWLLESVYNVACAILWVVMQAAWQRYPDPRDSVLVEVNAPEPQEQANPPIYQPQDIDEIIYNYDAENAITINPPDSAELINANTALGLMTIAPLIGIMIIPMIMYIVWENKEKLLAAQ